MRRVLLTLFLVGTLAGSASAAEYRPAWWPPSCKGALPCHNPANVKANTAFASGKTQDIVPLCDKINYAHEPAITMPDMYLICAKAGNVRKMGQMAWYYQCGLST